MPIRDLHEGREIRPKAMLLGHIRLGTMGATHPTQSETLIFTSADAQRLKPLQEDFGGSIEQYEPQGAGEEPWRLISNADAITVLFPFADLESNVAQSWELWQRSGLKRKCDGFDCIVIDVDEITGEPSETPQPCICAATDERECAPTTRLRFLLPQTGLGIWELVTGSRIGATQLWDQARFIDSVAKGSMNRLPIRVVYAPRQIRYYDEKKKKQATTTKRIVSLSVAGDAERALSALGMEPDRGLIAAVRGVLEETGRAPALPDIGGQAAPALPAGSPAAEGQTTPQDLTEQRNEPSARVGGRPEETTRPPTAGADDDEPANPEQWARAKQAGLSQATILKKARERFPDAGIRGSVDITTGQLAAIVEEALAS